MTRLPRTLGLLVVPILLAACANATSVTPGEGDTAGGSSVPGSSGSIDRENPTDRVMKPCGTEVVEGSGPDATVGYTPCPSYGRPVTPVSSPVEPTPGMADVHAIGWDTAGVSADGLHVTISFTSGVAPCSVLDHVDVAYGTNAVTITLFEGHEPGGGQVACPAIAMFKQTTVDLTEPVGGRNVQDGTD